MAWVFLHKVSTLNVSVFSCFLYQSNVKKTSIPGPSRWDGDEDSGKIRFIVPKFWGKNRMRSATQPYSTVLQYGCVALRMRFISQNFGTIKWILPGSSSPSHHEGSGTEVDVKIEPRTSEVKDACPAGVMLLRSLTFYLSRQFQPPQQQPVFLWL